MKITMNHNVRILLLISLISLIHSQLSFSETIYKTSISPAPSDKFISAEYSLWLPDAQVIRGIIVHQHGCGRNGLAVPYDLHWRVLAQKWSCALMGTWYATGKDCYDWCNPENGTKDAFIKALQDLAKQTRHPEIEQVPWVLWGHSGGGVWTWNMLNAFPKRIVAAFPRSAPTIPETFKPEVNQIPILMSIGAKERTESEFIKSIAETNDKRFPELRGKEMLLSYAVDPEASHNCGNSRLLAIPFFDACLKQRLPDPAVSLTELKPMSEDQAWLGDTDALHIINYDMYQGNITRSSWLPDVEFAKVWLKFCKTGTVADITMPPAPANLRVDSVSSTVAHLVWDASADLDSGIKTFFIYRDGLKIGQYKGSEFSNSLETFQYGNYGDEPDPEKFYNKPEQWKPPVMEYFDNSIEEGKEYSYQISTINWSDKESEKSQPASFKKTSSKTGVLQNKEFIGSISKKLVKFNIYLPAGYENSSEKYPVIYHLHGMGEDHTAFNKSVIDCFEKGNKEKLIRPVIIVFANGYPDSLWADSYDGSKPAETNVIKELIPYIDKEYRTLDDRKFRVIEGMSMGGYGACNYAFKYPELFSACISYDGVFYMWKMLEAQHSPLLQTLFGNKEDYFNRFCPWVHVAENSGKIKGQVSLLFISAVAKQINEIFINYLDQNGISSGYLTTECKHDLSCILDQQGDEVCKFIEESFSKSGNKK